MRKNIPKDEQRQPINPMLQLMLMGSGNTGPAAADALMAAMTGAPSYMTRLQSFWPHVVLWAYASYVKAKEAGNPIIDRPGVVKYVDSAVVIVETYLREAELIVDDIRSAQNLDAAIKDFEQDTLIVAGPRNNGASADIRTQSPEIRIAVDLQVLRRMAEAMQTIPKNHPDFRFCSDEFLKELNATSLASADMIDAINTIRVNAEPQRPSPEKFILGFGINPLPPLIDTQEGVDE